MCFRNLSTGIGRNLKIGAVIFSLIAIGGTAIRAQNINDDLKPKPVAPKSKPAVKPPAKPAAKPTAKPAARPTAKPTAKPVAKPAGKRAAQQKSGGKKINITKADQTRGDESRVITSETPIQIITRFMSFQQTTDVTDRDWKSVVAQTAKTLENDPGNMMAKAQSLLAQGQIAYSQRNYAMAATHFKSALQALPQSSLPYYCLGKTYLANGQAAAAERSFKEAIEQNENFALAYKGMGDALAAQGENKKATKFFKKATEISVKDGNMPL